MCRVPVKLRELVKQRLAAAAEEIFELLERTIAEYEEETERQRRLLDKLLQPRVVLNRTAESHPEPPQVKEEQEVLHSDIITSQLCSDVKTEDTAPPSEFEEVSGVSVKTEKEETQIEDTSTQPVPLPPPGGALLHQDKCSDHFSTRTELNQDEPGLTQCKTSRELVKQRLAAATEEIFELLERTIAEYEEETERQRRLLDKLLQPRVVLNRTEFEEVSGVSVKTEEEETQIEDAWTQPVPLPPPGGALIHHNQAVDCPGPEQNRTQPSVPLPPPGDALLHHNQTVDCPGTEQDWTQPMGSLSPPGGALLHQDKHSAHSDQNRRGVSKSHICTNCGKAFSKRYLLKQHILVHTGMKPFSCSVCGKRFSRKSNVQSHMIVHSGEKPFSCSVCGKRFSRKNVVQTHMSVHRSHETSISDSDDSSKKHLCPTCGKTFRYESLLTRHLGVHTREKHFSCSDCGKSFSQNRNLQIHMVIHTGEQLFSCSVCGKIFPKEHSLKSHMVLHDTAASDSSNSSNKPVCQSCGKLFRCMSELKRHMLVHTGKKPFRCSVCKKRFSVKWNLQCHMIVHTEECPFSCSVCGKSVKYIQNLRRHMALHKSRVTDRAEGAQDKTRTNLGLNQDWFKPINAC